MKLAILGDFHIPGRAREIPEQWLELLESGGFDLILCTGDLTDKKLYAQLEKYGKVECVRGNMDYGMPLPVDAKIDAGKYKVGMVHGKGIYPRGDTEQLLEIAEKMGVDILVHGHTHELEVKEASGKLLLNPGSATGAYSGEGIETQPSMLVVEIDDGIKVQTLLLINGNVQQHTKMFTLL